MLESPTFYKTKYPWDQWLDGREHTLKYGVDYHCKLRGLVSLARRAGNLRGMKVNVMDLGGSVIIRAKGRNDA